METLQLLDQQLLNSQGVRIISLDRPGYGDSSPLEITDSSNLEDWGVDVLEAADKLSLKQFSILGYSSSSPYALACAAHICKTQPKRLYKTGVVTIRPRNYEPEMRSWYRSFLAYDVIHELSYCLARRAVYHMSSANLVSTIASKVSQNKADENFLAQLSAEKLQLCSQEAMRVSALGLIRDDKLVSRRDWGIDFRGISCPIVVWHGQADPIYSRDGIAQLKALLPHCQPEIRLLQQQGHISTLPAAWPEVLEALRNDQASSGRGFFHF